MSIKQKAIKGVIWSAIQNWGTQAVSFIVFFVLARLLSPEDFGLVALANVFLAFMSIFLEQGFAQAIIQRQELEAEHLDTAFWTNLGIGLILAIAGFLSSDFVANQFVESNLTPILQCFSVLFIIAALSKIQQAILERKFEYKAIALRWLFGTTIGGVVGIIMAFNGFGVWSLVAQQMVHETVGTIVLWTSSDWRPKFRFSPTHFRHIFSFGISILGFNFISFFNNRVNDFLIGYFLNPVVLGYYTIAYRLLKVMMDLLVKTTTNVALPTFSRLRTDLDKFRQTFYTVTQLTSVIAFPCFFGMAILAPELIKVLFGEKWLPVIPLIQILTVMGLFRSVSFFKSSVIISMGKPTWSLYLKIVGVILNFILFAIAYRWGIIAVTMAYTVRTIIVFPIGQWAVSLLIKTPMATYLSQFISPLLSAIIMSIGLIGIKTLLIEILSPIPLIIICTISGMVIYGVAIRLLAPTIWQELLQLINLAKSKS
ncbi:MOP flippase family protein [Crocosphaera sp.]|uniref:MOP flippase family protein n=1 Tax=Crocosphaera sp. TaxID=2729996 RepID=UPI003F21F4C5|nr:MOP flippase family protein [Crocosphaera sp.]